MACGGVCEFPRNARVGQRSRFDGRALAHPFLPVSVGPHVDSVRVTMVVLLAALEKAIAPEVYRARLRGETKLR